MNEKEMQEDFAKFTPEQDLPEKDFMETPAMKRLLDAESFLMATGRLGEYHGRTIQEELKSLLDAERAELVKALKSGSVASDCIYHDEIDTVIEKIKNK